MAGVRPSRRVVLAAAALGGLAACSGGDGSRAGSTGIPGTPGAQGTQGASGSSGTATGLPTTTSGSSTPTLAGGPSRADWAQLRRSVHGTVVLPSDPAYDRVRLLENPRYDDQRPLAVLSVRSAGDVAAGLAFAQNHGVPVAIRSGGHSYPGWSGGGSPRALVLDCRPMHGVRLTGSTATIGAGASLVQVYDAVGSRGRAIAGGSCATVGIAGLTLGGGVGVLTRAMGLTCDAVTAMRVVTADGKVRRTSAHEEPDLFWALRGGGGGHLGVVTSFEFATTPAPVLQTFYLQWPFSAGHRVVAAWQAWAPGAPAELWSTLKLLGGAKHRSGPIVLVAGTWTGPAGALDHQLAGLLDHVPPPSTSTRHSRGYLEAMMSYAGCTSIPAAQCTTGPGGALARESFAATSSVAYGPLGSSGIADLLAKVDEAQTSGLLEAGISIDALGGRVRDVGPARTAFVHRDALATVQYTATFPPGGPKAADDYVHGFRAAMTPHWDDHAYVNYADPTLRHYRAAYFGDHAVRLAEVRSSYDPHHFFTQPQDY